MIRGVVLNFNAEELILEESELKKFCDECRENSKKIVLASGVYDILHPGHLKFLEKSREYGDVLIVAINDDNFARKKGPNRPIQNEHDRAYLIAGFECVNRVYIFDRGNGCNIDMDLLRLVQPNVYIMSRTSENKPENRTEHFAFLRELGGKVVIFDTCSTTHSSTIIEKINISI